MLLLNYACPLVHLYAPAACSELHVQSWITGLASRPELCIMLCMGIPWVLV